MSAAARVMVLKKRDAEDLLRKGSSRKASGEVDAGFRDLTGRWWRWREENCMLKQLALMVRI
jgi:hypothetical protein